MPTGGLEIVLSIAILLNLSFGVYIFVKYKAFIRAQSDPYSPNITKAHLDIQRSKAGMDEYERQVVIDLLRDQLKYSQEDYSALQGEVKAMRVQIADLKNAIGRIDNRLDNYRLLLSQIEENTRK